MRQKGFTLIEAIVATALFATIVTSIIGVYLSAIQLDRKTRAQRAVVDNARYITEFLTKEIRNGTMDYTSFTGGTLSGHNDLFVLDQASDQDHFSLSGTDLILTRNGASTTLNSTNVKVTNLKFYVQPQGDPFTSAHSYNVQPYVTVLMELTSNYGPRPNDQAKVDIQTTLASRLYPTR